jgi:hypothetical protein
VRICHFSSCVRDATCFIFLFCHTNRTSPCSVLRDVLSEDDSLIQENETLLGNSSILVLAILTGKRRVDPYQPSRYLSSRGPGFLFFFFSALFDRINVSTQATSEMHLPTTTTKEGGGQSCRYR